MSGLDELLFRALSRKETLSPGESNAVIEYLTANIESLKMEYDGAEFLVAYYHQQNLLENAAYWHEVSQRAVQSLLLRNRELHEMLTTSTLVAATEYDINHFEQ